MAIKSFTTLIKLHKRRVDVMRREMVAMEEERKQLLELSETLRKERLQEMQLVAGEPKVGAFFGAYSARIAKKRDEIAVEVTRLEKEIEAKVAAIREEFSEQKRFEIAREHAMQKIAHKAQLSLQQRFDEIATQQYLKKESTL